MRTEEQEDAREQRKDEPSLGLGRWGRRAAGLGGWQHSAEDVFGETIKPLRNRISAGNHLRIKTAEEVRKSLRWIVTQTR